MISKKLYILVGVPGSGKSTYANKLSSRKNICEADNFPGLYVDGKLKFSLLEIAHIYCRMCVEERMKLGLEKIIQSNTNLELKNIIPYINLAEKYDYKVYIVLPKYDLLYYDGIKDRKRQIQQLISSRGADRPNKHPLDAKGQIGYKHVPKDKILSMIRKFDLVKPSYEKLSKIHDPKELLKMIK
jgi:predicted kinase